MANIKGTQLHNSDEWATPDYLFNELDSEFHFTVDVCATPQNHKCSTYYTKETDGLTKNWGGSGCSVIPRILKYQSGLQNRIMRAEKTIQSWCC